MLSVKCYVSMHFLSHLEYVGALNLIASIPGPKVLKLFSCSAQLRLKFILLINVKMPTIVGILTFISKMNYRLWSSKPSISIYLGYFDYNVKYEFQAQLS